MLQTGPALVTTDGDILAATAANALKRLAAMSGDVFLHEVGGLEFDASAVTTGDTIVGQSAGVMGLETAMSQAQAQAGTEQQVRGVTAERIAQAIAALGQSLTEATQSDQEDEGTTNADRFVSPEVARFAPSAVKAWCEIASTGALADPDYNIATIGDTGGGDRDVNFTNAMGDANFAVGSTGYGQEEKDHRIAARTTADMRVTTFLRTDQSLSDQQTAHVVCGDQ